MACSARNSAPPGRGRRRWVIDAIDGTASFLAGEREWSTLIALEDRDRCAGGWSPHGPASPMVGGARNRRVDTDHGSRRLHNRPACDHHWREQPRRSGRRHLAPPARWSPIPIVAIAARLAAAVRRTSPETDWTDAARSSSPIRKPFHGHRNLPRRSAGRHWTTRCVPPARGRPLGHCSARPIIEEAGGTYAELADTPSADTASALFTNPDLHQQIINIANHKF